MKKLILYGLCVFALPLAGDENEKAASLATGFKLSDEIKEDNDSLLMAGLVEIKIPDQEEYYEPCALEKKK